VGIVHTVEPAPDHGGTGMRRVTFAAECDHFTCARKLDAGFLVVEASAVPSAEVLTEMAVPIVIGIGSESSWIFDDESVPAVRCPDHQDSRPFSAERIAFTFREPGGGGVTSYVVDAWVSGMTTCVIDDETSSVDEDFLRGLSLMGMGEPGVEGVPWDRFVPGVGLKVQTWHRYDEIAVGAEQEEGGPWWGTLLYPAVLVTAAARVDGVVSFSVGTGLAPCVTAYPLGTPDGVEAMGFGARSCEWLLPGVPPPEPGVYRR
jgi:hypothetical protein